MSHYYLQNKDTFLRLIRCILPKYSQTQHKGSCGRIGVIGGSLEYTGAPYFAAISSMRTGADLSFVLCASEAAIPIKSYSPDLIVLPILGSITALQDFAPAISRLHAVVLGPGLGRNPAIIPSLQFIVDEVKKNNIPLVVDADGLHFVNEMPSLVRGYSKAVLTPNMREFCRLQEKVIGTIPNSANMETELFAVQYAAEKLGCTILRKGLEDIISDGKSVIICDLAGSVRRCGGQGDLLSGSLGTFMGWSCLGEDIALDGFSRPLISSLAACLHIRQSNLLAYADKEQAMLTSDMINEIGNAFKSLFFN